MLLTSDNEKAYSLSLSAQTRGSERIEIPELRARNMAVIRVKSGENLRFCAEPHDPASIGVPIAYIAYR